MERLLQLVFLLVVLGRIQPSFGINHNYELKTFFGGELKDIDPIIPRPHTYISNNKNPKVWVAEDDDPIISLFDSFTNMPFYTFGFLAKRTDKEKWSSDFSNSQWTVDYPITDDFKKQTLHTVRGHLFPASFASTEEQYKATFQMTNVVAQDGHFNSHGAWRAAERVLKKEGIELCIDNGGTARMVTGAIPEDTKKPVTFHSNAEDREEMEIQVPGYMWTTMWCELPPQKPNKVKTQYHVSFIGPNLPEGKVTFFKDFQKFNKEVTKLYGREDKDLMWDNTIKPDFRDNIDLNDKTNLIYGDSSQKYNPNDKVAYYTNLHAQFLEKYGINLKKKQANEVKAALDQAYNSIKTPSQDVKTLFNYVFDTIVKEIGSDEEGSDEKDSEVAEAARQYYIGRRSG